MEERLTWRSLLSKISGDPRERQKIADALDINPVTITRWITGKSQPRQDKLRVLLDVLPQYREQLSELLQKEYPHLFLENGPQRVNIGLGISSAFYSSVLSNYTVSLPMTRATTLHAAVNDEMLAQLDPDNKGLGIFIAQCVPPSVGQKVHSVRVVLPAGGNLPFFSAFEHQTRFYGAESQAGIAIASARQIVLQTQEEKERMFPEQKVFPFASTLAIPILQYDCVAGSLSIASMEQNHFSEARIELIQHYANLLALAFTAEDFYELQHIQLRVMPPRSVQMPILAKLQTRIKNRLIQAASEGRNLTSVQAEREIIQEIEEELLQLALPSEHQPASASSQ